MYSLHHTIKSKSLTRTSKIRIYKTVIRLVLMYRCETWTLTKETQRKLRCFERKILRRIFGPYHDIVQEIKSQRLRWAGHVHKLPNNRLAKLIWKEASTERRPLGRPRMRWRDNIWSDLRTMGLPTDPTIMDDRSRWNQVVQSAKIHSGL
ncbi:unnamed protein product [Diabrotica balteata]|uniref:Endonuclease-reverse transcriptase n=1 Tax=Diabrotica balteata TaxID=107213 RepID=A0A9N9SWB9_DIABA|nr:unnamed protein product [Diabrotica balteata]